MRDFLSFERVLAGIRLTYGLCEELRLRTRAWRDWSLKPEFNNDLWGALSTVPTIQSILTV